MYDYSKQIGAFRDQKVRLSEPFKDKLRKHRQSNRDRLIARLPDQIPGITIGQTSFKPQGSMAMRTIIQTRFSDEEYDIDDGLVLWKKELNDKNGNELSAAETKKRVREALKDERFNRQPKIHTNCVRVFYADEDEEKHHVDFPVYRKFPSDDGNFERELASEDEWTASDPTQVNRWFEDEVVGRNEETDGKGTQMRQLIQLLKRFSRSRKAWDLPNGMKLTMLVAERQPKHSLRIDKAFRNLLQKLETQLKNSKIIRNLAHPDTPKITRTSNDANVCSLLDKIQEALEKLEKLDEDDCSQSDARKAWDWVFKSDGFFSDFDTNSDESKSTDKRGNTGHLLADPLTPSAPFFPNEPVRPKKPQGFA